MAPPIQADILLVDDRPENLLALEAILRPLGHRLVKAGSGMEALKQLLQCDFAVILLDVQMPGMDGFETAELIRGRERSQNTPIIFLTAVNTSDRHVFEGYRVGAVDYLLKPIVPEVLLSKVAVFVELYQKSEKLRQQTSEMERMVAELQHEMTVRQETEEELRRARDDLEVRVRERTAGLVAANEELHIQIVERERVEQERARLLELEQAARREAEAAVRLRDQFLSIASHELKTPLTSMHGNIQLLRRRLSRGEVFNERNQQLLTVVFEQTRRLNRLIDAMLDIARIQTGQLALERQPIALDQLIQRVVTEVQPHLEQHQISLAGIDHPLMVEGDALRLEQVIQNLLQNAVKYSPEGGTIAVQAASANGWVSIAVSDPGIGIPQNALPHLFQRFYRADNADPNVFSGLGIGLYVVSQIVDLHHGRIEVHSTEGEGSTFTMLLPAPTLDA